MSERTARALERHVHEVRVAAGHVISREGALGRGTFLVLDGLADVYVDGERIGGLAPGAFVGDLADVGRQPVWITARASTPMTLLALDATAFRTLVADPDVAPVIAAQLLRSFDC
jgi:CRP-like cAMP-binding protein